MATRLAGHIRAPTRPRTTSNPAVERAEDMVTMAGQLMGEEHVMHAALQTIRAQALIQSALERHMPERLEEAAAAVALSRAVFEKQQGAQSPNLEHVAELEQRLAEAEAELENG